MRRNKNVWILNHAAVTPDMPGGTRHFNLGKELVRKGYTVTIFASSRRYGTRKDQKLKGEDVFRAENYDDVRFIWIRTFPYSKNDWRRVLNWLSYMVRVIRIGTKLKENPEVVIGSSVHLFSPLAAYVLSRIKKSRFFFEVRDLWPQSIIDIGSIPEYHPGIMFFRLLERFLYKKAEKIITLLPKAGEYIANIGIPKKKITWIPNGVNIACFTDIPLGNRASFTKFVVMYLGSHGQANALDVVLDAAKIIQDRRVNEVQFIFVGDGPEKENLIKQSKLLNLRNVEFKNPVPKHIIPEIMSEADAFIYILKDSPVFKYGVSPNKLFEYMAAWKPVIFACNSCNNPIDEAKAGITTSPRHPELLADAVINLASLSFEERAEMGRRGRQYVEKNHDIRKLAETLIETF